MRYVCRAAPMPQAPALALFACPGRMSSHVPVSAVKGATVTSPMLPTNVFIISAETKGRLRAFSSGMPCAMNSIKVAM